MPVIPPVAPTVQSSEPQSTAEERLDNLIKSLTKGETTTTANELIAQALPEPVKGIARASTTVDDSEDAICKLKNLDSVSNASSHSSRSSQINGKPSASKSLNGKSGSSGSGVQTIVVGPSIIVPNNQTNVISKPRAAIPDMKCNILKAKEANLQQQQLKPNLVCGTCNSTSHEDSMPSNTASTAVASAMLPPVVTITNGHNHSHIRNEHKPEAVDDEDTDDDNAPLLGVEDTNNITVIPVQNGIPTINGVIPNGINSICDSIKTVKTDENDNKENEVSDAESDGDPILVETSFACANPITRSVSTAAQKSSKEREIKDVVKDHVVSARRTTSMNSRRTVMTTEL